MASVSLPHAGVRGARFSSVGRNAHLVGRAQVLTYGAQHLLVSSSNRDEKETCTSKPALHGSPRPSPPHPAVSSLPSHPGSPVTLDQRPAHCHLQVGSCPGPVLAGNYEFFLKDYVLGW